MRICRSENKVWKDTFLFLPFEAEGARYRNIFSDETVGTKSLDGNGVLYLSYVFVNFPVALMEKIKLSSVIHPA
jgi:hypothetical protein